MGQQRRVQSLGQRDMAASQALKFSRKSQRRGNRMRIALQRQIHKIVERLPAARGLDQARKNGSPQRARDLDIDEMRHVHGFGESPAGRR